MKREFHVRFWERLRLKCLGLLNNVQFYPSMLCKQFRNDEWKEIIPHLHPIAINILKIEHDVEKLDHYNLCIPPEDDLMGVDYDRAVRNLSKALHFFPPLATIISDDYQTGRNIHNNFIQGVSGQPVRQLVSYLQIPLATRSFLKRASGLQPYIIKTLYNYVFDGLLNDDNELNLKLYEQRISSIPRPTDSPNYSAMFIILRNLHGSDVFLTPQTKSKMFNAIARQGSWNANQDLLTSDFKSSLEEYLINFSLQFLLTSYIEKFNTRITDESQNFPDKYDHWFTKYILDELALFLQHTLIDFKTPQEIHRYIDEYWDRTSQINMARPAFVERARKFEEQGYQSYPQWTKAFEDCEINGVKFHCLINEKELSQEAEIVGHCSKGYGQRCRNGTRHIVSGIVTETGEAFTLRFTSQGRNTIKWDETVTQAHNHGRIALSQEAANSIKELLNKIESKEIKICSPFGNIDRNFTITDAIGCESKDLENLFQTHLNFNVIPTNSKTLAGFLTETSFDKYFDENFERHYQISIQQTPPPNIKVREIDTGPREGVGILD